MGRYLDPKIDIVFKKIFGEHPHLLKSFLNAVLPLPEGGLIESLEYLSPEQTPEIPIFKCTVVDVKCKDQQGRVFVVEMQINWTKRFIERLLFGTSTAYVRQLEEGESYELLQPVYGLGLLADIFEKEKPDWYHHYQLINVENPKRTIEHLQLIFIELPKFRPSSFTEKKLQALWLRFISELNEKTREIPAEWTAVPEIKEAVKLTEEAAYTPGELEAYERYWKGISSEKTLISGSLERGREQGREEGREKGLQEGIIKGRAEGLQEGLNQGRLEQSLTIAKKLLASGFTEPQIQQIVGISPIELEKMLELVK